MAVALDSALRAIETSEAVAFVADLWAAGGWETVVDGRGVAATRDGTSRRLAVVHEAARDGEFDAVDTVVVTGDADPDETVDGRADTDVLDAGDLYRRLTYGVTVDEREQVLDCHLGTTAVGPPESTDDDRFGAASDAVAASGPAAVGWGRADDDSPAGDADNRVGSEAGSADGVGGGGRDEGTGDDAEDTTPDWRTAVGGDATAADDGGDSETGGNRPRGRQAVMAVVLLAMLAAVGAAGFALGSSGQTAAEAPTVPAPQNETTDGESVAGASGLAEPAIQPRYADLSPTCERPPELVVQAQVGALRNNDPETNDGVQAAWRFVSPDNRRTPESYLQFGNTMLSDRYRPLRDAAEVEYGPLERNGRTATQQVNVTTANGTTATYRWLLTRQNSDGYDGCWMVENINRED